MSGWGTHASVDECIGVGLAVIIRFTMWLILDACMSAFSSFGSMLKMEQKGGVKIPGHHRVATQNPSLATAQLYRSL